jgi:hypothetical protein
MVLLRNSNDSAAFLEAAVDHLREAGYAVEVDIDDATGEACLYVDGLEVRFVKTPVPVPAGKPQKTTSVPRKVLAGRDHMPRRYGSRPAISSTTPLGK